MVVGVADAAIVTTPAVGARAGRVTTPRLLALGMVLVCLPVAFVALAVRAGVTSSDRTIDTVGTEATRGITVAQDIKLNLAELDQLAVGDLLVAEPVGAGGFPEDYAEKRREVHASLVLAAAEIHGEAYQRIVVNIDYALGHYHALLRDTFAAAEAGDTLGAAELYRQAHEVMAGTLLPQADQLDKSSTYVLNDSYRRHQSDADDWIALIAVAAVVLVVCLVAVQVVLGWRFRRVLNLALIAATLLAVAHGVYVVDRLDTVEDHLASAREGAFDSVHALARAQAVTVAARQVEGQMLLDPENRAAAEEEFQRQADRIFRVPAGDAGAVASSGEVPEGAGGYLATAVSAADGADPLVLQSFGDFMQAHESLRQSLAAGGTEAALNVFAAGTAYRELTDDLQAEQANRQDTFDDEAGRARDAVQPVDRVNLLLAGAVLILVLVGLGQRLREYRS